MVALSLNRAGFRLDDRGAVSKPRAVIASLFLIIVALLFAVSGGLLWDLGINYDGITGAMATKIHPATYFAAMTLVLLIVARRNPASYFVQLITRHPGTLTFLLATLLLGAYIVLDGRRGITTIIDTYLLSAAVVLIAAALDARDLQRVEKLIHILMAVNAACALVEYALDQRFFPYRFEGMTFEWDRRSSALIGHPLENALMTGTYIMALLAGGGSAIPKSLRFPAVLLQFAAMVPFGGRTALLLASAMTALWIIPRIGQVLRGRRMSLPPFAAAVTFGPLFCFALGAASVGGFFDVFTERFADDGGSAESRLAMFDIFDQLSTHAILLGGGADVIDSIRRTMGLEWGIENPVVRLLLYQGVIFTSFLLAGFVLFLFEIARSLRPGYAMAFVFFIIVINSYESISNKSASLARFAILMLTMFRIPESHSQTVAMEKKT
jgi:hypothetical protein